MLSSNSFSKGRFCFQISTSLILLFLLTMGQMSAQEICRADTSFTDILFVVDNSQSIDDLEYEEFSDIIMATINNVQQKCTNSQIGLIHYGGAFGKETFVQQPFSQIMQISNVERQFCTVRNAFNNCSEGGGDDLNNAMGDVVSLIEDGTLNRNPINKLVLVIFTDAFGFEDTCSFINCSVIRPFTNIDILKAQFGAQVTVVGVSEQAEASLLAIYASPGGTFNNVDLFAPDCPSTFDGCTLPRKYIPIEFESPIEPTSDSIAVCVNCTVEIINGVTADAGDDQMLCFEQDNTATISAQLINGTPPLIFSWDQGLGSGSEHQVAPNETTTYSVTITDANGCSDTDEVTVVVESCIPPCGGPPILICPADTLLCPGASVSISVLGMAEAMPADVNCPAPIVKHQDSIVTIDNCNEVIYRIWTAVYPDNQPPLFSTCTQIIELRDNEAPEIGNMPNDIIVEPDLFCQVQVSWDQPVAIDNCGIADFQSSIQSGSIFTVGTTYVVYSAEDVCGNIRLDSFAVIVQETCCDSGPLIVCPPDYIGCPMGNSDPSLTGVAFAQKASEFCSTPIVSYSDEIESFGSCSGQVIIKRTWIARDSLNPALSNSCVQMISLLDTLPPTLLNCPPDVFLDPDNPVLEWEDPRVSENCNFRLSYSVPNGSTFSTGTTKVLVTATDLCGNIDTCSFTVTVPEEVMIICPDEQILHCLDTLTPDLIPMPTVSSPCDLCTEDGPECVQISTSIDTVIKDGGQTIYTIRYVATDLCGTDNECTSQIIIDNDPYLTCSEDIIVEAPVYGFTYVDWDQPSFFTCCDQCNPREIPGFLYMGQFGDSYYYCSYARVNWEKAKRSASENGGHLVTINSAQENSFIAQRLIERHAYIGLNDQEDEGIFVWEDGDLSNFRRWKPGQPDDEGGQDVVEMDAQGYWFDVDGLEKREFVMEIEGCHSVIQIEGPKPGSKFRPGTTTITYFAEDGCGQSAMCSFDITVLVPIVGESTLSSSRSAISRRSIISPNPAIGKIWITGSETTIQKVNIFTMNGQLIHTQLMTTGDTYTLDVAHIVQGLYILEVVNVKGVSEVHKLFIE